MREQPQHQARCRTGPLLALLVCLIVQPGCNDLEEGLHEMFEGMEPVGEVVKLLIQSKQLQQTDSRRVFQLPNGLVVIAQDIPTAPVVSVQCWVKTGSIYEQQHNGAGLSHFLEHLVSGGTTGNLTEDESSTVLGQIGAQTNAATSLDTVRYYINTSSDHTREAIFLISDWMQNSLITQAEFDRERDVIQREFDMGRGDPGRIFWKLTQQARYQAHPARHPTIGYLDEFLSITRDEVYAFYKQMYVPNNMVFVVAGDIDLDEVATMVAVSWKDAEPGELPELSFPVEPAPRAGTAITGEADIQRARMRLAWPGVRLTGEHDYALDLLARTLGGGELSRLVKRVRDDKQLVTSIDAFNYSAHWGEGFVGIDAVAEADQLDAAKQAILGEVRRVREQGVSADELARAKSQTIAAVVMSAQTAEAAASRLASDFIATGDPDYLRHYAKAIESVTAADLKAAANAILTEDKALTIKLLPSDEPIAMTRPDEPTAEFETQPFDLDNARLVEKLQALASPQAKTAATDIGPMTMYTLPNGLRLITQRNTRLPVVAMQWYHLGGQLAESPDNAGIAKATATMLIKGAGDRSADDIARLLEETGASMSTGSGSNTFYVNAEALSKDWLTIMRLMGDVIQRPTFDNDEWGKLKPRLLAAIASADDRWSSELFNRFHEVWYGEHPWSQLPLGKAEIVEQLTDADLLRYHADRLSADQSVLAVVGDIDPEAVIAEAKRVFAALPEEAKVAFDAPKPPSASGSHLSRETNKPMAAVVIGYGPVVPRQHADYPTMSVATRIVSNFPSGWLSQALRGEGPGLVYASWGFYRTGVVPGYWAMAFNTQPAKANLAIERSLAITERLRSELVDEQTLDRAITAALVREAMGGQSNSQRATAATLDELYGLGYDHQAAFLDQLRSVTAEQIRAFANDYLTDPVIMVLSNEPVRVEATVGD